MRSTGEYLAHLFAELACPVPSAIGNVSAPGPSAGEVARPRSRCTQAPSSTLTLLLYSTFAGQARIVGGCLESGTSDRPAFVQQFVLSCRLLSGTSELRTHSLSRLFAQLAPGVADCCVGPRCVGRAHLALKHGCMSGVRAARCGPWIAGASLVRRHLAMLVFAERWCLRAFRAHSCSIMGILRNGN